MLFRSLMQGTSSQLATRTLIDTLFVIYTYLALEWLFLVTKPSFFTVLDWPERINIVATAALPLLVAGIVAWLLMLLLSRLLLAVVKKPCDSILLPLPLALILTVIVTLLVDNFTYTLTGLGIASTSGGSSLIYSAAICILAVTIFRKLLRR